MINKSVRCKDAKVNEYIEALENELIKRDTSGIDRFIRSANSISIRLAEEMEALANGDMENISLLSNEKDDKLIDRVVTLISKVNSFAQVSELAEELSKKYVIEDISKVEDAPEGTVEDMVSKKKASKK